MNADIGDYNFGTGNQGGPPISSGGPDNVQAPPPTPPPLAPSPTDSTISKSELEQLAVLMFMAASYPNLTRPVDGASIVQSLAIDFENKQHDIINSMWDRFLENIRKFADEVREDEEKERLENKGQPSKAPKTSVEYLSYLFHTAAVQTVEGTVKGTVEGAVEASSSKGDSALAVQFDNTFKQWMTPDDSSGLGYPSAAFIAGALLSNVDLFKGTVSSVALVLDYKISTSPVADALFAAGPVSGLPGDYQAAAAMIAALLNGGAALKASKETIEEAANAGKPSRDLAFAQNYAESVMAIVTRPMDKGEQSNPLRAAQNKLIRLMLSTMALNLLYRSAFGGMSGKELEDMLNDEDPNLPNSNIPDQIKPQMQKLLALINEFLPQDPAARSEMISRLKEYVDSKDSVDSMLETTRDFNEVLKTSESIEGQRKIIAD